MDAINGTGMPVEYSWTASNGNKFTNVIEVLEDHTYADDLDMNTIGNTVKGNYTWKNEWYVNSDGTGNKIDYGVDKPDGNDITIYGKWVSTINYNLNGAGSAVANKEVIKGQPISSVSGLPSLSSAYTFKGWCAKNPTAVGDTVLQETWIPTGNITIYAKRVSVMTINLDVTINQTQVVDFNGSYIYEVLKGKAFNPGFTVSRYYYKNNGSNILTSKNEWATGHDGAGTRIAVNGTFTPTGNLTIYPIWYATVSFYRIQHANMCKSYIDLDKDGQMDYTDPNPDYNNAMETWSYWMNVGPISQMPVVNLTVVRNHAVIAPFPIYEGSTSGWNLTTIKWFDTLLLDNPGSPGYENSWIGGGYYYATCDSQGNASFIVKSSVSVYAGVSHDENAYLVRGLVKW